MKCRDCKRSDVKLTRHSKIGGHQPPFIPLCRDCHDKRHGMKPNKGRRKANKKVQRGTPYGKHKKT